MERLLASLSAPRGDASGPPLPAAVPRPHGAARGFTLIELIVVVILIGIFATMAIPSITRQLRDRRVHETAQRVALLYQQARARAMGQGGAILVRYGQGSAGQGMFQVSEALVGGANSAQRCANMPSASCTDTDWNDSSKGQFRVIETLDFGKEYGLSESSTNKVLATLTAESAGASGNDLDVCFTPGGRTFKRYVTSTGTPFTPLTGVPRFNVFRALGGVAAGLTRHVLVLPSGLARLEL